MGRSVFVASCKNLLAWEGIHPLFSPWEILKWKAEAVGTPLPCQSGRTTASRSIFKGRLFSVWREGIHPPTRAPSGRDQKSQTLTMGWERAFSAFSVKENKTLLCILTYLSQNLKKLNILKTKEKTLWTVKDRNPNSSILDKIQWK